MEDRHTMWIEPDGQQSSHHVVLFLSQSLGVLWYGDGVQAYDRKEELVGGAIGIILQLHPVSQSAEIVSKLCGRR